MIASLRFYLSFPLHYSFFYCVTPQFKSIYLSLCYVYLAPTSTSSELRLGHIDMLGVYTPHVLETKQSPNKNTIRARGKNNIYGYIYSCFRLLLPTILSVLFVRVIEWRMWLFEACTNLSSTDIIYVYIYICINKLIEIAQQVILDACLANPSDSSRAPSKVFPPVFDEDQPPPPLAPTVMLAHPSLSC